MQLKELIKGVQHLGIPVYDIKKAAAWYTNVLGFKVIQEKIVMNPYQIKVVFVQLGDLLIELYEPSGSDREAVLLREQGVIDHYAIDTPDFEACAKAVRKSGGVLHPSTADGCVVYENIGPKGVRCINFTGPSGEIVELNHNYAVSYGHKTGLQGWSHLALKVKDLKASMAFYDRLGFGSVADGYIDTKEGRIRIAFLECHGFQLELIQPAGPVCEGQTLRKEGKLDHIALDVSDAAEAFYMAGKEGFKVLDVVVRELPFFAHGVRYFTLEGPDGERIELNQIVRWGKI